MAPRLPTTVCLIACLALLATVSAHRVSTTMMVEILNPGESRGCRQQIQGQRLNSCRQYLRDSSRFSPANDARGWREEFPRCCEELEQINRQCRCEAIKQIAEQHRQTGELQGREMREMMQTAQALPALCRISTQYCENIQGGGVY